MPKVAAPRCEFYYDADFEKHAAAIFQTTRKSDERMLAVEWAIIRCKDLSYFPVAAKTKNQGLIRYLKTDAATWAAPVLVLFSMEISPSGTAVTFHDIRAVKNRP
jgi:hypothetical protein